VSCAAARSHAHTRTRTHTRSARRSRRPADVEFHQLLLGLRGAAATRQPLSRCDSHTRARSQDGHTNFGLFRFGADVHLAIISGPLCLFNATHSCTWAGGRNVGPCTPTASCNRLARAEVTVWRNCSLDGRCAAPFVGHGVRFSGSSRPTENAANSALAFNDSVCGVTPSCSPWRSPDAPLCYGLNPCDARGSLAVGLNRRGHSRRGASLGECSRSSAQTPLSVGAARSP
jgi:hypothetical protein